MLLSIAKIRYWIKIAIYTNRVKIGIAKLKISKLLSIHIVIQLLQHILLSKFPLCAQQRAINLTGANPVCEGLANQQ